VTTIRREPRPTPDQVRDKILMRLAVREARTAPIRGTSGTLDSAERLAYLKALLRTDNAEVRAAAYNAAVESDDEAMRAFAHEHKDAFFESDVKRKKEREREEEELKIEIVRIQRYLKELMEFKERIQEKEEKIAANTLLSRFVRFMLEPFTK
jgi:hypothetical protein